MLENETLRCEMLPHSRKARQIEWTISCVEEALVQLVAKHSYHEISVSALCAKAGVGRQTFYRYFADKNEVIRSRMRRTFQTLVEIMRDKPLEEQTFTTLYLEVLQLWKEKEDWVRLVNDPGFRVVAFSEMDYHLGRTIEMLPGVLGEDRFTQSYRHWGMKGILREWARSEDDISLEQVTQIFLSLQSPVDQSD